MAEEIVIGKLIIDTGDLNASMAASKKEIIALEDEQKKLKKETDNLTNANDAQLQSFVDNELQLKKMKAEYSANQKSVLDLTKAQMGLDAALAQQNKTQDQATANTNELIKARRAIDATTVDGAKAIADINAKIDQNNKFVNASNSALEQQKVNIGNYPQIIGNVGNAFGGATQRAIGFVQQGKDIIGSLGEVNTAVTNSAKNIIGFGNASNTAAIKAATLATSQTATGVAAESMAAGEAVATTSTSALSVAMGILLSPITLIIAAGLLVFKVFSSFQPVVDKVEQGMSALVAVFTVLKNTFLSVFTGTKSLSEAFSGLGADMSKAAKESAALTKAQQDLEDAMASQEIATAKNRAGINKLNVELKNRTKTEQERLAISDEIIKKENEDFQQRKKLVDEEVRIARAAIAIKAGFTEQEKKQLKETGDATKELAESRGGNYDKEYKALNAARLKAIALEDESTVNLEKQYARRDKLQDEAEAKRQKALEKQKAAADKALQDSIKNAQNRIDILKLEAAQDNLTTDEKLSNLKKIFELETDLAKKSSSGPEQQKAILQSRQNLSSAVLALAEDQINKEIENQKKLVEATKVTTQETYNSQVQSAEDLATAQKMILDKKLLSERDYATAVLEIDTGRRESLALAQKNFDESEKIRKETEAANAKALEDVAFEIRLQDIQDKAATENEIKQLILTEQYNQELLLLDQSLADKKVSEDLYLQKKILADKKYASETAKNDKVLAAQKRANNAQMAGDSIAALQSVFGESKALAVAGALVNTYQGIAAGVSLGWPMAIPAVLFAAASGFAAVKNILKTDKNSTSIDSTAAKPVTTSGASSFVNTAQTETVARVSETPVQQNAIVTPPVLVLESLEEVQANKAVKVTSS